MIKFLFILTITSLFHSGWASISPIYNGVPDTPEAYCVPADYAVGRGTVVGVLDAVTLDVDTGSDVISLQFLGTESVSDAYEVNAYTTGLSEARSLVGYSVVYAIPRNKLDSLFLRGYVFHDDEFINYSMIANGLLQADFDLDHPCRGFFAAMEKSAFDAKAGIWAEPPYPPRNWSPLASFFTPEIHFWKDSIVYWAQDFGLDMNIIAIIMQIESCGHPTIISHAGAIGLFQVMPDHFGEGENPFDPETNARRGLYLFQDDLIRYEDVRLAFASYNAGYYRAGKAWNTWPQETKDYVWWAERMYEDALHGASESEALQDWLDHGGRGLCARAEAVLSGATPP